MLRRLLRLRRDPGARHLVPVVCTAVAVEVALPRLAAAVGAPVCLNPEAGEHVDTAVLLGPADSARLRAVQILMRRWPFGARGPCLRRALVAGRLLRHRQPHLVLGAMRDERGATAHAWLLVDGVALDADAERWTPLLRPGVA